MTVESRFSSTHVIPACYDAILNTPAIMLNSGAGARLSDRSQWTFTSAQIVPPCAGLILPV